LETRKEERKERTEGLFIFFCCNSGGEPEAGEVLVYLTERQGGKNAAHGDFWLGVGLPWEKKKKKEEGGGFPSFVGKGGKR